MMDFREIAELQERQADEVALLFGKGPGLDG